MKNVLLLVHDDKGQEARFQAALDLTRALEGHLSCVDVAIMPGVGFDDYVGNGGAMLLAAEQARESENKAALQARLEKEDVSWDWTDVTASISGGVISASTLADVIVMDAGFEGYPSMREMASQILVRARKPLLAVPQTLERMAFNRALIAWDGRASCAATMRACTPLLALADEVEIFMVRDGAERTDPLEAAQYLSRHNIHATVRTIDDALNAPDVAIAQECERWRPDYVLMGAYGRGRLMEAFGGVTKRMLGKAKLPLLLGH
ncbi:MAG: universal stress protein [Sphingomonadales bacterium]|nr:universal stress protein [Sphingomonadales bacterium]